MTVPSSATDACLDPVEIACCGDLSDRHLEWMKVTCCRRCGLAGRMGDDIAHLAQPLDALPSYRGSYSPVQKWWNSMYRLRDIPDSARKPGRHIRRLRYPSSAGRDIRIGPQQIVEADRLGLIRIVRGRPDLCESDDGIAGIDPDWRFCTCGSVERPFSVRARCRNRIPGMGILADEPRRLLRRVDADHGAIATGRINSRSKEMSSPTPAEMTVLPIGIRSRSMIQPPYSVPSRLRGKPLHHRNRGVLRILLGAAGLRYGLRWKTQGRSSS